MPYFRAAKRLLNLSVFDSQLTATAAKSNFGTGVTLLYLLVCISSAGVIFQNNAECLLHTASSMSGYINVALNRHFISQEESRRFRCKLKMQTKIFHSKM